MRSLRSVLPVRSPITLASISAGLSAATRNRDASRARLEVAQSLLSRFGASMVSFTDSGTSALSLALRRSASVDGKSRPVALPAYACYDLATAIDAANVPFILYDVDPETLGPDWESLRRALEAGADRVVVVHLYGVPADMNRLRSLAAEFNALVIEDAAQGIGGWWEGLPLGAFGSLGVLSFGRGKGMTGGRGGALLANDEVGVGVVQGIGELPESGSSAMEAMAFVAQWMLARPLVYGIPASISSLGLGETKYHAPSPARQASRFCMGALSRTIGLVDTEAQMRRKNAARLTASFDGMQLRPVIAPEAGEAGFLRLPVIASINTGAAVRRFDARRLGVMPGYPTSLASLDGFGSRRGNARHDMSGAETLARRLITLPTHGGLSEFDLRRLEDWCSSRV